MYKSLRKHWRLFWKFRQLRLMLLLEYRNSFFFWSLVSVLWTAFNYFFFSLIVSANNTIAGWNQSEMYVLISTFTILDAFTWSFFYANMTTYTKSIFYGEMTTYLTRPVSTQFLVSIQNNSFNNIFRLVIGIVVLVKAVQATQVPLSLGTILLYVTFMILSLLFIYSLWFIVATCAFWVERLDNINELIPATRRMWQVPRGVYSGLASTLFTVILPLGLISTIPSEILLGKGELRWMVYYGIFAVGSLLFSTWFFRISVKRYSGVGN